MKDIPWEKRIPKTKQLTAPVDTAAVADRIDEAIQALAKHWDECTDGKRGEDAAGTTKAFNPNDPQTGPLFGALWEHAFPEPAYSPPMQEAILKQLEIRHPGSIDLMRDIGYYSEWEMEKGFCDNALARAAEAEPLDADASRKAAKMVKLALYDGNEELIEKYLDRYNTTTKVRRDALDKLITDFPYPTYDAMHFHEALMVSMLEGKGYFSNICKNPYVIVEAGALPLDAVYASISRLNGEVIITNKDPEAHERAVEFIQEMERLHIVEPNMVTCINIDPLSKEFQKIKWHDYNESWNRPVAALVSQRVHGAKDIQKITEALHDQGLDTILTRSAHGMVKLLYEPDPTDAINRTIPFRISTIPTHSDAVESDHENGAETVFPRRMTYNTTRVFSEKPLRNDWKDIAKTMDHIFCTDKQPRSLV